MDFDSILNKLIEEEHVTDGKMMSAPGIKYKGKVFAYKTADKMGFKLGKGFEIEAMGISEYNLLNPFKNKPPLAAWFEVSEKHSDRWPELADLALSQIKSELDK